MYTKITNPIVDAYDIETNQFIGEARFQLSNEAERDLLNWINNRTELPSLVMLSSDFQPSEHYVPIVPNETYHQRGVFRALLTQADTGTQVPVEVEITYDWRSRSIEPGNYISSVEFSNVKIESLREFLV